MSATALRSVREMSFLVDDLQNGNPTYVLLERSPYSRTSNPLDLHLLCREKPVGTIVYASWIVTFVTAKGSFEGQVIAESPMAWVRSTTV